MPEDHPSRRRASVSERRWRRRWDSNLAKSLYQQLTAFRKRPKLQNHSKPPELERSRNGGHLGDSSLTTYSALLQTGACRSQQDSIPSGESASADHALRTRRYLSVPPEFDSSAIKTPLESRNYTIRRSTQFDIGEDPTGTPRCQGVTRQLLRERRAR
jgi:hypothetical protein